MAFHVKKAMFKEELGRILNRGDSELLVYYNILHSLAKKLLRVMPKELLQLTG